MGKIKQINSVRFTYVLWLCLSLFLVTSCGGNSSKYSTDAEGFGKIQKDLISKFGENAYYDQIFIGNNLPANRPGGGIWMQVNVTKDPESLKMEEWAYTSATGWKQTSDITVEIPEGADMKDFLFQLGDKFDLKKVGEMVTSSAKKLADEKNLKNAVMESATFNTMRSPVSETKIFIYMKPENGGTTFDFRYDLDGNLEDFSY
jgi:hypothetical protein